MNKRERERERERGGICGRDFGGVFLVAFIAM